MNNYAERFVREDGRKCSGSRYMDGPWHCGSGDCMGQRPDCTMRQRNADLQRAHRQAFDWLIRPEQKWEQAWRRATNQPELTIYDSPYAGRLQ